MVRVHKAIAYGPHDRCKLDLFVPSQTERATGPLTSETVVFFYGGTWSGGQRWQYRFVGRQLARAGACVLLPDYRTFPPARYPDFMLDSARVWALAHALTSPRSAGRAPVLMGHSAGGHIAALLVLNARFAHIARALAAQTAVAGSSDVLAGNTAVRLGRLASLLAKRSDDDLLHLSDRGSPPDDAPPAVAPRVEGPLAPRGLITLAAPFAMYPTIYAGTREIFAPAPRTNDPRPYANLGAAMATPHLILHGARDRLIDPWIVDDYAAKLRDLGVDGWRMRKLGGLGHVGIMAALVPGVGRLIDPRQSVRREIIRWISALSHDDGVAPHSD